MHEVFLEGNEKYRLSLEKGTGWLPIHKTKIPNFFIVNDVIWFVKQYLFLFCQLQAPVF